MRREITSSRSHVLSLVKLAMVQGLDGTDWSAAAAQADALWRERGNQRDPLPLVPIAARLRALNVHVHEQMTAALPAVEIVKNASVGPDYRPHLTTTNQLLIASANTTPADEAGPCRPIADNEAGSNGLAGQQAAASRAVSGK